MPRQLRFRWQWRLRASPEQLWPYVADTDRFNRDTGLPSVRRLPGGRHLSFRRFGIRVEWDEEPFEWVRPVRFGVQRHYRCGPVASMRVQVELIPDGSGTLLIYQTRLQPRGLVDWLTVPIGMALINRQVFGKVFLKYDRLAVRPAANALATAAIRLAPGGRQRLSAARAALNAATANERAVAALINSVEGAPDEEVNRIRPYTLADVAHIRRRLMLELALRATQLGVLDMRWDMVCPSCRGVKGSAGTLSDLPGEVHCEVCDIDVSAATFERAVELTFRPNPSIRRVEIGTYCIGGPEITPQVAIQQYLDPDEVRVLSPSLQPGLYRVRAPDLADSQLLEVRVGGLTDADCVVDDRGLFGPDLSVAPSSRLRFRNLRRTRQLVLVEATLWSDQAVTAADVTSMQAFRDLFARELLRPGEQVNVGTLTVLFTDLRESTRLYQLVGDAPAFGRVRDHFAVLRQAVESAEGAVVKTIGDAVMAVFPRPAGALPALLEAQLRLATMEPPLQLKAGLHMGPCLAVTLNDHLDYFGSTVNFAARLERFSTGTELVISNAVYQDPEVQTWLEDPATPYTAESFEAAIKGFDAASITLWRLRRRACEHGAAETGGL